MGIDAQRSGASELPVRAVEVRRAQGATSGPGNWQRKSTQEPSTTKAIPVWIVEEEQRKRSPHSGPCNLRQTDDGRAQHSGPGNLRHADDGRAQQDPCALRVAAALATRPSVLSPRTPSPN